MKLLAYAHSRVRRRSVCVLASLAVVALGGCGGDDTGAGPDPDPDPDTGIAGDVAAGMIQTWAGTGEPGFNGDGKAPLHTRLYWPQDLTITSTGTVIALDWNNGRVRELLPDNTFLTTFGTGFSGDGDPVFADLVYPGALANTIQLNHMTDLLELQDGTFMLAAWHNHKIRIWNRDTKFAYVLCGRDGTYGGDGGPAGDARLHRPVSVAQSPAGDLYIADQSNLRIRKIDSAGVITTVVGTGQLGYAGDGGSPLTAMVSWPNDSNPWPSGGMVFDASGRLYFADSGNNRIRRVDFSADLIETVIGDGTAAFGGDGGPGTAAQINYPRDMEWGPDGLLYFADEQNYRIRSWDPATGIIRTVAGNGTPGYSGDGGPALDAQFNRPGGLEFDAQGRLYIADTLNNVFRRMRLEGN
jgi:DNA-binding beta-propeller fold protein YncE